MKLFKILMFTALPIALVSSIMPMTVEFTRDQANAYVTELNGQIAATPKAAMKAVRQAQLALVKGPLDVAKDGATKITVDFGDEKTVRDMQAYFKAKVTGKAKKVALKPILDELNKLVDAIEVARAKAAKTV